MWFSQRHAKVLQALAKSRGVRKRKIIDAAESLGKPIPDFRATLFAEQLAAFSDPAQLVAVLCSRRAGKTTGGNHDFLYRAARQPHGRFLYVNETRAECKRLAWHGSKADGMFWLAQQFESETGRKVLTNETELTIHIPDIDSWIYLIGADDERGVRKALGNPFHRIWWDEAQKIPPKLTDTIRSVLMPTLLDYNGSFLLTGTPVRNMVGIFYDATRSDEKRDKQWTLHRWSMLHNPFFGRDHDERWRRGVVGLQTLLGGPDAAPLDSPAIRREALGEWVKEDANYVYALHRVPLSRITYAPVRRMPNGFPDIKAALADLPFSGEYFLVLGVDLGYSPDPFAFVLWAWAPNDPCLYEVCSYKQHEVDSDSQVAMLQEVRDACGVSVVVADAGGGGKQVVAGWSRQWVQRYGAPIIEAEKQNKHGSIEHVNSDILQTRIKLREDSALLKEWSEHQWASTLSATGKLIEDPTTENHCSDAGLYAHRHTYHLRFLPEIAKPTVGTAAWASQEEAEMEEATHERLNDENIFGW